jgi:hypothetical protein
MLYKEAPCFPGIPGKHGAPGKPEPIGPPGLNGKVNRAFLEQNRKRNKCLPEFDQHFASMNLKKPKSYFRD